LSCKSASFLTSSLFIVEELPPYEEGLWLCALS